MADDRRRRPDPPAPQVTGFAPGVATELVAAIDDVNSSYRDTVALLAELAGGADDLVAAWVAGVDATGAHITLQLADGTTTRHRLAFGDRAETIEHVHAHLHELVARARALAAADVPATSLERELAGMAGLQTFVTTVVRTRDLTPGLREVTVSGGLAGFHPLTADQFLYVMVPHTPHVAIDDGFTLARHQQLAAEDRPAAAYYTVRRWRPDAGELDLWFVTTDHDGPVAAWAARAEPGERVALWGPRSSYRPPTDTTSLLLLGDETALAAIAAILDARDPGVPAQVVVEAADATRCVDLGSGDDVAVHWRFRGDDPPGRGTRLLDAVRGLDVDVDGCYAFGAAESRQIAAVRQHLRHERRLAAHRVRLTGYWRRAA